ncbi:hypothetical protein [Gottfriedia acidiceleris]|uniref:Uncharacterized protein n=1 Tax=Gottfriedia acidiceleris TaxID=371036 RepID=A0ABY4JR84_9BACI|nr:hypothetical protein [Gottfriedia acidiceleris]UPM55600.1 hypothetical protein MY490_07130 [Gottfriedia acidiceleris]
MGSKLNNSVRSVRSIVIDSKPSMEMIGITSPTLGILSGGNSVRKRDEKLKWMNSSLN